MNSKVLFVLCSIICERYCSYIVQLISVLSNLLTVSTDFDSSVINHYTKSLNICVWNVMTRYVQNLWNEHLCPCGQENLQLSMFNVWYNLIGHNSILCNLASGDCWYEAVDEGSILWMSIHIYFDIRVLLSNINYFNAFWSYTSNILYQLYVTRFIETFCCLL
jgi:hypothetical protein